MVKYIRSDLEFILEQIKIAEAHADGQPLFGPNGLIPTYNLAWGLRTVDGTYNNPLHPEWGAADNEFPEPLGTQFKTIMVPAGPGGALVPVSYTPGVDNDGPGTAGPSDVFDPYVRTISNLIVDQTLANPSAILTGLQRGGVVSAANQMTVTAQISAAYEPLAPLFKNVANAERADAEAQAAASASPGNAALAAAAAVTAANLVAARDALDAQDDALMALLDANGIELDGANIVITNAAPDEGLSAPFNSWFTLFGQFFDHGLDLVAKGGNGTVFIPLMPDDPLYVEGSPTNFMVLTRATLAGPGPDGIMVDNPATAVNEAADNTDRPVNTTTSFVDQNQTYTSHPSHQVFLREYVFNAAGDPVATGKLITGGNGGMATWADLKAQAADILGIQLVDANVGNVPLLATDQYGNFLRGPNGFPQLVTSAGLIEGDPTANGGLGVLVDDPAHIPPYTTMRTGHAFLADIAHNAVPEGLADGDIEIGLGNGDGTATDGTYDNELLDAHYVAGDGRANENIGLTAVHHVFHSEHNRLVEHTKQVVLDDAAAMVAGGSTMAQAVAFLNEWLINDVTTLPVGPAVNALVWDGERVFQAAKFGTEMQYQHLVFEEFARKIQPNINVFLVPDGFDVTIDPSIVAEFAHVVYRFGHSMLNESIDRFDPNFNPDNIGLIEGFLNPIQFENNGTNATVDADISAGAIIRGMTRQVGNEIDEFVTSALRNNLLGLPLDLATINLARGRDTGVPSLNEARRQFYEATNQDALLKPYESWVDFAGHLKHEASIINFIAAYGTHNAITTQQTIEGKRDAALTIITGISVGGIAVPPDRLDFLNATGAYATPALGGLNNVDLWIGGLAEQIMPFGGMLGSTFNFVFEMQMEKLQSGDRFYYLQRLDGLHLFGEMENNSFAAMIERNTDVDHLPSDVFSTPGLILEVNKARQYNPDTGVFTAGADGILGDDPLTLDVDESADDVMDTNADPVGEGILTPLVIRNNPSTPGTDTNYLRYTGGDHVVLGGTDGADILIAGIGDDTLHGDGGNDILEGGFGNDIINAGDGDDIIKDAGGDDNIKAGAGNDVVHAGGGLDLVMGNDGQDFIFLGTDMGSEVFAGTGNDFIYGNKNAERILGNEGNDWIETGTFDGAPGDNFDEVFAHDKIDGHDVFLGDGGFDEFIGEGGDDIFVGSPGRGKMAGMSGFDWVTYKDNTAFVNADLSIPIVFDEAPVLPQNAALEEFTSVEGLSGTQFSDVLKGSEEDAATMAPFSQGGSGGYQGSALDAEGIALVKGLQAVIGAGVTSFTGGDIILGGDGNDSIQGNGGDDIIDGDKWLDVQIGVFAVSDVNHTGTPIALHKSMTTLAAAMFNGSINPGQLAIVREIKTDTTAGDIDTAVFRGAMSEYAFSTDAQGRLVVSHAIEDAIDGTDRLSGIERLQFADGTPLNIVVGTPYNDNGQAPQGAPPLNQPVLNGSAGADLILGMAGFDVLNGLAGNDILVGGAAGTTITTATYADNFNNGSFGNTTGSSNWGPDWVETGDNNATNNGQIRIDDGNNTLRIVGGGGSDGATITRAIPLTTAASATITFSANPDNLDAGETVVAQFTANGTDWVTIATITGNGASQNYTHTATGPFPNASIRFVASAISAGDEVVNIDDLVITYTTVTAGTGVDTLNGGLGDDTYSFGLGDGNDTINEAVNATSGGVADKISILSTTVDPLTLLPVITELNAFDSNTGTAQGDLVINYAMPTGTTQTITVAGHFTGGNAETGVERINFNGATYQGYDLGAADYVISRSDTAGNRTIDLSASTANNFVAGEQGTDDVITGGLGNDLLFGGSGDNTLNGGDGLDLLVGGSGNDVMDGGGDADVMIGGADNDTYIIDDVEDRAVEAAGQGTDTVQTLMAALSIETMANVENLTYTGVDADPFVGTGNAGANTITGGDLADTLTGLAGADTLVGGLGADTMIGGADSDVYVVDEAGDVVTEVAGGGTADRVESDIDYTLGAEVENLDLNGTAVVGRGNALGNVINGNDAANQLFGGGGNDTLNGVDGNDLLDGGDGNDTLTGGDDNDTFLGGNGDDTMDMGGGFNTVIYNSINFGADVINSFDSAGGTPANQDRIDLSALGVTAANFNNRVFETAQGANTLITIRENGAASAIQGTILINGSNTGAIDASDFTLAAAAPPVFGAPTAGANTITGNAAANTINGLGGNDTLSGAGGDDVVNGGEGIDTVNGGDGNDTLSGGTGSDTGTYGDNFGAASYTNSDGSVAFAGAWTETNDGTTSPTNGDIVVTGGRLAFIQGTDGGESIQRSISLTGATSANVSFQYEGDDLDAGESVLVEAFNGTTWQTLGTLGGDTNGTANFTAPLTAAHTAIRFTAVGNYENGENFYVDNFAVNFTAPGLNAGTDIVNGDAGDDTVVWNANASGATDGRDRVNGGTEGIAGDLFVINGNASAETYRVYTQSAALAAGFASAAGTEIVITRQSGAAPAVVIAELSEIEEIRINGIDPSGATGPAGGDTFEVIGDFSQTSLRLNTITVTGSSADDVVDITKLSSEHRVVFDTKGGADTIQGDMRSQDVVNVTGGGTLTDNRAGAPAGGQGPAPADGEGEAEDAVMTGGSGDDHLSGGSAGDKISGGSGDDTLKGRSGNDVLNGGSGDDVLEGGSDNDQLNGGSGDDELNGGSGNDVLNGGSGDDVLTGGSGADIFRFGASDSIMDFAAGEDRIDLSSQGVTAANFAQQVKLTQAGDDVWLAVGSSKMLLAGVDADDVAITDFLLSEAAQPAAASSQLHHTMQRVGTEESFDDSGPAPSLRLHMANEILKTGMDRSDDLPQLLREYIIPG